MTKQHKSTAISNQLNRLEKISEYGDPLECLSKTIEWEYLRSIIENMLNKCEIVREYSKPNDSLLMFKILLLQHYYNLDDDQIEYQILDRLSFCRFLNLSTNDPIPNEEEILSFKRCLVEMGLEKKIFNDFDRLLEKYNLKAYEGKIIDVKFVETSKNRVNSNKNTLAEDLDENVKKKKSNTEGENSTSLSLDIL
ncbi:MAG: transposase [Cyclobacteriaceae bacterium]|nr:transposase [Cyclobacteriaceae bacterium]